MTRQHGYRPPLILHVINRLAIGGLENGVVNLINHMPRDRYRHAILCLTNYTDFRDRIQQEHVQILALHKVTGQDVSSYWRLWRTLRTLRPAIVHTRNLPTLEYQIVAAAAGVTGRIHGEHGRDMYDLVGMNQKYNLLRKLMSTVIHRYTAVSLDLQQWLVETVGIARSKVAQIYNGVDTNLFCPRPGVRPLLGPGGFMKHGNVVIGTVGRLQPVKDQLTLIRAFIHLLKTAPQARDSVRLVVIGDGPLKNESQRLLDEAGVAQFAWLPGERANVPNIMQSFDLFVLPSLAEGISNTILEAMASGLPVVATKVGGNPELVEDGVNGLLVPAADPIAMAEVFRKYLAHPDLLLLHGRAARKNAEAQFSMSAMVNGYIAAYDHVLAQHSIPS